MTRGSAACRKRANALVHRAIAPPQACPRPPGRWHLSCMAWVGPAGRVVGVAYYGPLHRNACLKSATLPCHAPIPLMLHGKGSASVGLPKSYAKVTPTSATHASRHHACPTPPTLALPDGTAQECWKSTRPALHAVHRESRRTGPHACPQYTGRSSHAHQVHHRFPGRSDHHKAQGESPSVPQHVSPTCPPAESPCPPLPAHPVTMSDVTVPVVQARQRPATPDGTATPPALLPSTHKPTPLHAAPCPRQPPQQHSSVSPTPGPAAVPPQ